MWKPMQLSESVKRRTVLASFGSLTAAALATLPGANAEATLKANVEILTYDHDAYGDIHKLTFALENHSRQPILPVATCWGAGRQTQHPWGFLGDRPEVADGSRETYTIRAPGDLRAVRLRPGVQAQLTVYDKGTEARAVKHFEPVEAAPEGVTE